MFTIGLSILLLLVGFLAYRILKPQSAGTAKGAFAGFFLSAVALLWVAMAVQVPASHTGVVTTFGKIQNTTLPEGLNFISPFDSVHEVFTGVQIAEAQNASAASRDLQNVHATLNVNFHPEAAKVRELYALNPNLDYASSFVAPAAFEVFKAVVARYTAEELVTKRSQVSGEITDALNAKLAQYHIKATNVNLVNFGFSKAFDLAIEEKVTATQKAATAQNNLVRVKSEVEADIERAKGTAEAIRIQAAAVAKAGGEDYVRLQAIDKWDGKLPTYMTAGAATPFVGVK